LAPPRRLWRRQLAAREQCCNNSTVILKRITHWAGRKSFPAARARFQQLDTDHDGTLSQTEAAKGGITPEEFRQANTKGARTLSEQEYLGLVKMKFEAADRNHDRTLSSRELNSPAGQSLINLLSTNS
jgi:EF hand